MIRTPEALKRTQTRSQRTDFLKHALDANGRLCARLEEEQVLLLCEPLCVLLLDCTPLGCQVDLVAYESDYDARIRLPLELPDP